MSRHKRIFVLIICPAYIVLAWVVCRLFFPATIWLPMAMFATLCGVPVLVIYMLVTPLLERISQVVDSEGTYRRASKALLTSEATAFRKLLAEAAGRVADSHQLATEHRRPPLSRLPLFLLVGEERAGKTSTFLAAGVEPEFLSGEVPAGAKVTPTQLCNLWLVRGAVVADLSGKLFAADLSRWMSILTLLAGGGMRLLLGRLGRVAGPQTLRGVVLFCDVTQFAGTPDPSALENLATRTRERLLPIGDVFRTDFPVYVVFSKTDKLKRDPAKDEGTSFFKDYFGRLNPQEEQAILGCTLPPRGSGGRPAVKDYVEAEGSRVGEGFDNLYLSLAQHRLRFLAGESDASRRPGIYEFPRELRRLRNNMVNFLVEVFRPNDSQPGPVLRGFYFTGTREVPGVRSEPAAKPEAKSPRISTEATKLLRAEDLQALLRGGSTARSQRSREPMTERWAFVSDLFNRLIIGPRVAAVPPRYRPADLIRMAYAGLVVTAGVILVGCIAYSYWGNTVQLTKTQLAVDATYKLRPPGTYVASAAPAELYRLYVQLEGLRRNEQRVPWRLNFGLNHADRVLPGVRNLYFKAFREYVLNDTVASLERTIQSLPSAPAEVHPYNRTSNEVRAYRALTVGGCAPSDGTINTAVSVWGAGRSTGSEDRAQAQQQFNFYVRELRSKHVPEPLAEQAVVVDRGRAYLASFSAEERVYGDAIEGGNQTTVRSLTDYSPNYKEAITVPPQVPPAFTRDGWKAVDSRFRDGGSAGDSCIASEPAKNKPAGPDLERTLRAMYVRESIKRWKEFLSGIQVNGYRESLSQADQRLAILSDQRSPILGVLCLVNKATDFPAERGSPGPGDIRAAFEPIHKLFPADADCQAFANEASNKAYLDALVKLRTALAKSSQPGNAELSRAAQDGLQLVAQITSGSGAPDAAVQGEVKRILAAPFREGSSAESRGAESAGAISPPSGPVEEFNAAVKAVCDSLRPLLQKYPFNPGSNSDAKLAEVQTVFSPPNGTLYSLAKLAVNQNGHWAGPAGVKLPPNFSPLFQRLMNISHALFPDGGMRYRLAVQSSPGGSTVALTIGGVSLSQGSQQFLWPGTDQDLELRVKLPGATVPRSYGGLWSIFSMMADADPRPAGSDVFPLTNPHAGRHSKPTPILDGNGNPVTIRFQVQEFPGGVKTAFDRDFFTGLACPPRGLAE